MSVNRVAFITFHACPLAAPGEGKSGGMNVYVHQLARALGSMGVYVDIFTRDHPEAPSEIQEITPMVRVIHLAGGDPETPMGGLFPSLPEFEEALLTYQTENRLNYQIVHSHFSGLIGRG